MQRICSPNKKWSENDESCICSSDGFRMYCTPTNNQVNLRRIRSIRNKRSHNCCNNDGNKQSDNCCKTNGHYNRCFNNGCCCIPNNMFNCNGNINFCNCMRNYFCNCMCRNYQNFGCNGNRRRNIKRLSCCDNCCEGQCGSEPNWKCYCTHNQNTVPNIPDQPSKFNNSNQFSVNIFECDASTGNLKTIDLNTFYDFCKLHATSNTGSKTEPTKINLNTVLEFCKQQIDTKLGQVNTNCCSNNKHSKQQINPTQQKQENVNVNTQPKQENINVNIQTKQENINVNAQPKQERNKKEREEGLKSIFNYMKSYTEYEEEEKRNPKSTTESRNPAKEKVSAKDQKEGFKQIFKYMKSYIDNEKKKRRNIQDKPKSDTSPTTSNKKQNKNSKQNTHPQPQKNHKKWSNQNNPNNKAYKGKDTRQGHSKGRTLAQHLSLDNSGEGDVVTVESNEMVYISM